MPLSPRVHAQLKRYVNARLKAINFYRTGNEKDIAIPKSIIPELHVAERIYAHQRRHFDYDYSLVEQRLPRFIELIREQKQRLGKRKVRILDVAAGNGLVKIFIDELNNAGANLLYRGVDVNSNPKNNVLKLNPVIERLPKRSYDLIISIYGFMYFPDVLHGLENTIDALSVGGKLVIVGMNGIYLNGEYFVPRFLFEELQKLNPHLEIKATHHDGLSIVKTREEKFNWPYKFAYAKLSSANEFDTDLYERQIGVSSICKNYYVSDQNQRLRQRQ